MSSHRNGGHVLLMANPWFWKGSELGGFSAAGEALSRALPGLRPAALAPEGQPCSKGEIGKVDWSEGQCLEDQAAAGRAVPPSGLTPVHPVRNGGARRGSGDQDVTVRRVSGLSPQTRYPPVPQRNGHPPGHPPSSSPGGPPV